MEEEELPESEAPREEPLAREGEHVPPAFESEFYHCPLCGVLSPMAWKRLKYTTSLQQSAWVEAWRVRCNTCGEIQFWVGDKTGDVRMVRPQVSGGPRPHVDMPQDVRSDYEEARSVVGLSPRGACALLRLATQKLVNTLQTEGGDLNDRIGKLVDNGLPVQVQQALDALRVIGNEAVHPGELNLEDDIETATGLFELINVVVEDRITRPKHVAEMFAKLPPSKLQGIQDRDRMRE